MPNFVKIIGIPKAERYQVENKTADVGGDSNCSAFRSPFCCEMRTRLSSLSATELAIKSVHLERGHALWVRGVRGCLKIRRGFSKVVSRLIPAIPPCPGPIDRWSIDSMEKHDAQCPIERNVHLPSITSTADILIVAGVGWPKLSNVTG